MRFYNAKQGTIVVKKLDKQTGKPLAGVEFELSVIRKVTPFSGVVVPSIYFSITRVVLGQPLAGVEFQITYSDGSYLDDDYGHLSSKGLYSPQSWPLKSRGLGESSGGGVGTARVVKRLT